MRKAIALVVVLTCAAGAALAALDEMSFARRVRCEVQDADGTSLDRLTFQQGTTPLISCDVFRNGRAVSMDASVKARFVFGSSATAALYGVATNYAATNNSYLVQLPTIGTNSAAATNGLWWYTVYFDRAGQTFWTGNGELVIEKTTSTADGTVWQEITTSAAVSEHNTNGSSHADIRALVTTATSWGTNAWNIATNALAQISAHLLESWQTVHGGYILTAWQTATNALHVAQTEGIFTAWLGTNTYVKAEADTVWGVVSNAVTQGAAAGLLAGTTASNIVNQIAATGTYYYATSAGQLSVANGAITLTVCDGVLTITEVTNTTSVRVTATAGEGYNGPAVGTVWSDPPTYTPEVNTWNWTRTTPPDSWTLEASGSSDLYEPKVFLVEKYEEPYSWSSGGAVDLPSQLDALRDGVGTLTLDWVPATNVTVIDLSGYVPTNRTVTVNGQVGTLDSNVTFTVEANPTLQDVLDNGNTATNDMTVGTVLSTNVIASQGIAINTTPESGKVKIQKDGGILTLESGDGSYGSLISWSTGPLFLGSRKGGGTDDGKFGYYLHSWDHAFTCANYGDSKFTYYGRHGAVAFRSFSDGRFSINTNAAAAILDVNGDAIIRSNLTAMGSITSSNRFYFGNGASLYASGNNIKTVSPDGGSTNTLLTAESDPVFTNWASTNTYIMTSTNLAAQDAAGKYVPTNRTITLNGATGTLDSNVTFTVTGSTDAPAWIAATNTELAITITNDLERPQYLYATGAVSLAFAGLRPPQPFYLVVKGPDSITFPAGTHFVGGASWQTNQANHFIVWQYSTNLFVNPVTTSTED